VDRQIQRERVGIAERRLGKYTGNGDIRAREEGLSS